jgi:hypothetical protein
MLTTNLITRYFIVLEERMLLGQCFFASAVRQI